MSSEYVAPNFESDAYTCIHCGAYAAQALVHVTETKNSDFITSDIVYMTFRRCFACERLTIWNDDEELIYPLADKTGPPPHPDMPREVQKDYDEARSVAPISPRAGGALLRLGLQRLCEDVAGKKGKIDDLIGDLEEKGLPNIIVNAMDIVRVTGNQSVHPGEMNVDEDPDLVKSLFELMNMIVEELIARPKRIQTMYDNLPDGPRSGIEQRKNRRKKVPTTD